MKYTDNKVKFRYDLHPPTCRDCLHLGQKLQVRQSGKTQVRLWCQRLKVYTQHQASCDGWAGRDGGVLE